MRIPDNRIRTIAEFFRQELGPLYSKNEVNEFIFLSMREHLGFSRTDIVTRAEETVSESDLLKLNFVVKDLKKHRPIQYILGSTEFYGCRIKVNENVLIPRSETEELVELIVRETKERLPASSQRPAAILDIGTGSGCIAIALKKSFPDAEIFAMDVSEQALEIARENAQRNGVAIHLIHHDILSPLPFSLTYWGRDGVGAIISNPPYVLESEKTSMRPNVLLHEPHLALFVKDNDPLLFYKAIADFGLMHLAREGRMYFEINESKTQEIKALLESKGYGNVRIKKDLSGKDRFALCKRNV